MKHLTTQTADNETIRKYLAGELPDYTLSDAVQEKMNRIDYTRSLIEQGINRPNTINKLLSTFKINRNQATDIYFDTLIVYDINEILLESLQKKMAETRRIALAKQDAKVLAMCDKNEMYFYEKLFAKYKKPKHSENGGQKLVLFVPDASLLPNKPQLTKAEKEAFIKKVIESHKEYNQLEIKDTNYYEVKND